jgi:hypothetical protein
MLLHGNMKKKSGNKKRNTTHVGHRESEMFRKEGKEATSTYARKGTKEKTARSNQSLEKLNGPSPQIHALSETRPR